MEVHRRSLGRAVCAGFLCVAVFAGSVCYGWSPYANVDVTPNKAQGDSPQLPFDPNDYNFLIYDCNGGEDSIDAAMQKIGIDTYTVCDAANPVTTDILASHDILIVGWDGGGGNKSGLVTSALEQRITGRVILSGHDSDYHTVWGPNYAEIFFIQEIDFVLKGSGTGMIVCADVDSNFDWIPGSWGIVMDEVGGGSDVSSFTQEGLDSGIYEGLLPENMSDWGQSYHNTFSEWGQGFRAFELGYDNSGIADRKVVTIATPVNVNGMVFEKTDDAGGCLSPGDELTYTISWENPGQATFTDLVIVDYLPAGVTYPGGDWQMDPNDFFNPIPPDPAYDPNTHSYTWEIGDSEPNDTGSVTLTVDVNEYAAPGMPIRNVAKLMSDGKVAGWASVETQICCWDTVDPNIIYVDQTATGYDNGTSWADAYTDLQRALTRVRKSVCDVGPYTILVAQRTYNPGDYEKNTFMLPDGASLYGGFMSGGSAWIDRNPDKYPTVLTGYIGLDENENIKRNEVVVMMGDNTRLDGFIVEESSEYGVYGSGVSSTIENCTVRSNVRHGMYFEDGNVSVRWSSIVDSGRDGIYHSGEDSAITIENCQIVGNQRHGIRTEFSSPIVKNSVIAVNGSAGEATYGVSMALPEAVPLLCGNSIAYNYSEGISFVDNEPNLWERDYPDIQNCILWYNNDGGKQLVGYNFTQYSCVFDPNDPEGADYTVDAYGNFSGNPGFAYQYSTDPNVMLNIHLAYDSPCIDKGSPYLAYNGQTDIDAKDRVVGNYVDIGADEVYSCDDDLSADDIYNAIDWTADGIVNMHEFGIFARAWLSVDPNNPICDPNNPNYVSDPNDPAYVTEYDKLRYYPGCDLDDDLDVDLLDLGLFCDQWLWMACWKESQLCRYDFMMMETAMGGGESMMMSVPMMEPVSLDAFAVERGTSDPMFKSDSQLAGFIAGVNEIIDFVDAAIEEDPSGSKHLYDLKASLEDVLWELYDDSINVK